jgi:UDP-N-acetylmuramoyl-tripeptide--D-alanyl-D-alanine ligase
MMSLPSELVLLASGAAVLRAGPEAYAGVSHDTRTLAAGSLYVAIRGERLDGHDFVAQAEAAGAAGIMIARGQGERAMAATKACAVLEVDDPILALGRVARAWRRMLPVKIVALTGSVGKTSTKEMLASILVAAAGEDAVHKTRGNLNNHIGVPLTLLGLRPTHRYAVVEMGMSSLGEIAYLEHLTRPNACVVTKVAGVHLEQLGSIENIGRAKGEIFEGAASTGAAYAIYPHGERLLDESLARVPKDMRRTFGKGGDVSVARAALDGETTKLTLALEKRWLEVSLSILGAHQAENAAAATAAARCLEIGDAAIIAGLSQVKSEKHRMQVVHIDGRTLIDDCYNASPPSVRAALDALAQLGGKQARRIAILGDMLELGPSGPAEHAAIGRYAGTRANEVIALGPLSKETVAGAGETLGEHAAHVGDPEEAAQRAMQRSKPGDLLLVKGSRGMKLERVIEAMSRLAEGR